jgi:hypothetical protein
MDSRGTLRRERTHALTQSHSHEHAHTRADTHRLHKHTETHAYTRAHTPKPTRKTQGCTRNHAPAGSNLQLYFVIFAVMSLSPSLFIHDAMPTSTHSRASTCMHARSGSCTHSTCVHVLVRVCAHAFPRVSIGVPWGCSGTLLGTSETGGIHSSAVAGGRPRCVFGRVAAGVTWKLVIASTPWAERESHTTVIDAAGNFYLIGGDGDNDIFFGDVWESIGRGACRTGGVLQGGSGFGLCACVCI